MADSTAGSPADDEADAPVFTSLYHAGDRPITVVLLPALFVGNWLWDATWEGLNEAGWPVIRFDQAVSGVDRHTARSLQRVTTDLLRGCRRHTSDPLVVCGDSLGALIAVEFAKSYPDEIAGIVVSGAPGLEGVINFGDVIGKDFRDSREVADRFLSKLIYRSEEYDIDEERYSAVVEELSRKESIESILASLRAIKRYPLKRLLPTLDASTLLLWGRYDEITPVGPWEKAVTRMKDARLVVFDDCGHAPMFEQPDGFNRELLSFLEQLASARPVEEKV